MLTLILIYAAIGATAGLLAGVLGLGGGLVIIPALTFIFAHQPDIVPANNMMHFVVGTSLASILPTTLFALRAHLRHKSIDPNLLKQLIPGIIMGTIAGSILASFLHTNTVKTLFGIFVLLVAIRMFISRESSSTRQLGIWGRRIGSFIIGNIAGILGVGGGVLTTPWLNHFSIPIRQAIATSTACGVVISLAGIASYTLTGISDGVSISWGTGYIYWPAVLAISILSPIFAHFGVSISHRLPTKILKNIFAVFVSIVGVKMLL
ncbi:MAG: rane protein [Gammaproteobacteria bacterium]|jgi:uncharacterized membrane protein YfcA|nr:rane protein [Gammaproteobacteria bacterium]